MKLLDIHKKWSEDSNIDMTNISGELAKQHKLHSFYSYHLSGERKVKTDIQAELSRLRSLRHSYYQGELSPKELEELGWKQFQGEYRKWHTDTLKAKIDGDEYIVPIIQRLGIQEEKIELLKSILREIQFCRPTILSNIVKMIRFENGES